MPALRKAYNILINVAIVLAVIIAVSILAIRIAGINVYTVISGSMEPTYHVGSIILVKPVEYNEIKVGDAVTFVIAGSTIPATHRVVKADNENRAFYTKGDSNEDWDISPVKAENIIGKPIITIPYVGYAVTFIQKPVGIYITIAIAAVILFISYLSKLHNEKKQDAGEA